MKQENFQDLISFFWRFVDCLLSAFGIKKPSAKNQLTAALIRFFSILFPYGFKGILFRNVLKLSHRTPKASAGQGLLIIKDFLHHISVSPASWTIQ